MGNRGVGFCSFSPAEQLQRKRFNGEAIFWNRLAQLRPKQLAKLPVKLCQRHPKSKGEMKFFVSNKVDAWEEEQLKTWLIIYSLRFGKRSRFGQDLSRTLRI
jgi:hypothetical protein